MEFDGQGRESRRRYVDVNTSRFEQSSAYDAVGNVVDRREVQTRDSALERRYLFELDKLNRVTKQADGTSSTPPSLGSPRYQWTFDAADNWLTTTQDTPGSTWEREINAQNEYTRIKRAGQPDVAVGHDWRGNTAQHGDRLYFYDWDNRLVSVMDTNDNIVYQYAYDALGRLNCRLKYDEYGQPLPYEFLHYAGRGLVTTYQSGVANSQRWFITSPRTGYLVGMWVDGPDEGTDPEFHAALHNSRGDVSALTQNGVVSESYHYSTYGRRTVFNGSGTTAAHDSPLGNVIGLTGQISLGDNSGINCDPESYFSTGTPRAGLWHMNARTYSPSLGRFVQRDPSGFADGANLYAYARSNPWVYVDPEGLATRQVAKAVGGASKQAWDVVATQATHAKQSVQLKAAYVSGFATSLGQDAYQLGKEDWEGIQTAGSGEFWSTAELARQNAVDNLASRYESRIDMYMQVNGGNLNQAMKDATGFGAVTNDLIGLRDLAAAHDGLDSFDAHQMTPMERAQTGLMGTSKATGTVAAVMPRSINFDLSMPSPVGRGPMYRMNLPTETPVAPVNAARTGAVRAYEVGTADALRARSLTGDALDIHHVGQARPLEQLIPGYNRATGPAMAIPETLHDAIPTLRGAANLTPRQVLANDIWNLRTYTNAPNSSLQDLIELNKQMYPGAF